MDLAALSTRAANDHLILLGGLHRAGRTLYLLGPAPDLWPHFTASPEYADGEPDPMDRWSRRVISAIAEVFGAAARFPFGGPPHEPFCNWAAATGRAWPSPVSLLAHSDLGLMFSVRGALDVPGLRPLPRPAERPCETCPRPCTTACPVGALSDTGYDVDRCKTHVTAPEGAECRARGCLVRRACPLSPAQPPPQASFHMEAFLR